MPGQTGFVKDTGWVGGGGGNTIRLVACEQAIRLVDNVVEQTNIHNIPGILVQLDFCKAFDTIE